MNDKMVSVIIPVYNREKMIEESVMSVLKQSYQNFEVILIDDGSTDKSVIVCDALASSDPRIKLLKTKHLGVSGARNIGLEAAEGEYVFFLDSDDIIHPKLFEILVTNIEQTGAKMAGTSCRSCLDIYWENLSKNFINDDSDGDVKYNTPEETLDAMFNNRSLFGMIGGVMIRRDLIGNTRFSTDLFLGEDFYFVYENLIKGADSISLKQHWYLCRNHSGNTYQKGDFESFWSRFYRRVLVWKSEEKFGRKQYVTSQKRDAFSCFNRFYLKNNPYSKNSQKMRKVLREYKKEIIPVLNIKGKLLYTVSAYFPLISHCILKLTGKISTLKSRRARKKKRIKEL